MKKSTFLQFVFILMTSLCIGQKNPIDSLKSLLEGSAQDTNRVNLLLELSKANFSDAPDEAIRYATLAKDLSAQLQYMKGTAYSYKNLGLAYYFKGDYIQTLDFGINPFLLLILLVTNQE
ncbi:MAG: hypothetical protein IPK10_19200 [Bacteroidetes bacterium]|nr:hypothetical protein [Bacteroidota bacterium]